MSSRSEIVAAGSWEEHEPRFDTKLLRQFVHKRAVEETLITDIMLRRDGRRVLACAQLPRSHALHNEVESGFHDLLLILEAARQSATIYAHVWFDVPEETAFVMSGLRCRVTDLEALRQGDAPAELIFDAPLGEARHDRRGRVRGFTLAGPGRIDGRTAVEFHGEALLIPKAIYERVRTVRVEGEAESATPPRPVEPARVGRFSPRNVTVGDATSSDGELRCALIADTAHPTFFDHPLDHTPGMLMLETARQAALLHVGESGWAPAESVLDACEANFTQYAALSPPASCHVSATEPFGGEPPTADTAPTQCLRVQFSQAGVDIGYADLRLRKTGGIR